MRTPPLVTELAAAAVGARFLGQPLQPYEVHIPFHMHFLDQHGLVGMGPRARASEQLRKRILSVP